MFMNVGLGGLDTPDMITEYIRRGAEEFFAGFIPREWLEKYGWEVCPNRRPMGAPYNYSQAPVLREVVQTVHEHGGRINLAVNAHDNGSERLAMLHDQFNLFETMEPDGYIVADPALLFSMKAWGIERPIHLSTGVGCFNSESVRFFCDNFPIRRLIIPRKLTIREMRLMMDGLSDLDLEYEVMIIGYRCFFNDEDCHSVHSAARRNLCGDIITASLKVTNHLPKNWKEIAERMRDKRTAELHEDSPLNRFRQEWQLPPPPPPPDFSIPPSTEGLDGELARIVFQTCGLCAIKPMRDIGIQVLKVPLRGDEGIKSRIITIVNTVMQHPNPTREMCMELINSPEFCRAKYNCYYHVPEA